MNDCRVPETVLAFVRPLDRLVGIAAADERQEGHHLLGWHEWVVDVSLAKDQLETVMAIGSGSFGQQRCVLAKQFLGRSRVAMFALTHHHDGPLR